MVFSLYVECCMGVLENKGKIRGRAAPKGLRPAPHAGLGCRPKSLLAHSCMVRT